MARLEEGKEWLKSVFILVHCISVMAMAILRYQWRRNHCVAKEPMIGESLRGNLIGATGPRASDRENLPLRGSLFSEGFGRRTEQAKANLDPRVGPRVGPRVAPRVRPREPPREHPRGLISLFSALQGLPTKHPTKVSTEGPTSGRSGFTCPVFTCSDLCRTSSLGRPFLSH